MGISSKREIPEDIEVKIGGNLIEKVSEIKYLGVIIDDKLNFLRHLEYIKKKLAMLKKIGSKLDAITKTTLYKSLVAPHFDYWPSILFSLSKTRIQGLPKIQNKAMQNILWVNRFSSVGRMLGNLGFQSVNQRFAFNSLKLVYKIENNLVSKYLKKLLKKNEFFRDIFKDSGQQIDLQLLKLWLLIELSSSNILKL